MKLHFLQRMLSAERLQKIPKAAKTERKHGETAKRSKSLAKS